MKRLRGWIAAVSRHWCRGMWTAHKAGQCIGVWTTHWWGDQGWWTRVVRLLLLTPSCRDWRGRTRHVAWTHLWLLLLVRWYRIVGINVGIFGRSCQLLVWTQDLISVHHATLCTCLDGKLMRAWLRDRGVRRRSAILGCCRTRLRWGTRKGQWRRRPCQPGRWSPREARGRAIRRKGRWRTSRKTRARNVSRWWCMPTHKSFVSFELSFELLGRQRNVLDPLSLGSRLSLRAAVAIAAGSSLSRSPFGEVGFRNADHAVNFNLKAVSSRKGILDSAMGIRG